MSMFGFAPVVSLARALTRDVALPVYELDRSNVQDPKGRIRPFDQSHGFTGDPRHSTNAPATLRLTGFQLAHAVKKADCLRRMPFLSLAALGFLIEQMATIDWRHRELRLFDGMAGAHPDFAGTSLAGRIGQGIALLLMEARGYPVAGHYPQGGNGQRPDFIVETRSAPKARALVESKGSFVRPGEIPNIKGTLNAGLAQIAAAPTHGAAKSFAVGSFVRETGDSAPEPSLVAFVDPESDETEPVELPGDWAVRQNYGAWLDAMGLFEAAADLRSGKAGPGRQRTRLRVVRIDGIDFGVATDFPALTGEPWWFDGPIWPDANPTCLVKGLAITILRSLKRTLASGTSPGEDWAVADLGDVTAGTVRYEGTYGSLLSDGSLLAAVPLQQLLARGEEFEL